MFIDGFSPGAMLSSFHVVHVVLTVRWRLVVMSRGNRHYWFGVWTPSKWKQTLVVCEKSNHMKDGRRCSTDIVVILVGPLYPLNPDWTLER